MRLKELKEQAKNIEDEAKPIQESIQKYMKDNELLDLMKLVNYTKRKIDRLLKPAGYNIGMNLGKVAGAGFPGHAHMHIVPRWTGDTNFMPVIGNMKVVSCSLKDMYNLLEG